jgi:hypothetical protein
MRSKYLLTPAQYRARAELLRRSNPYSRAAELAELAARAQELTAHERRAGLIAQLHQQAIAAADDLRAQRQAIGADIAKTVRRRSAEAWLFVLGTLLLALGCIFVCGRLAALAL